jgi:hypothetical protein
MRLVIVADGTGQLAGSFCHDGVEMSLTGTTVKSLAPAIRAAVAIDGNRQRA